MFRLKGSAHLSIVLDISVDDYSILSYCILSLSKAFVFFFKLFKKQMASEASGQK